MSAEPVRLACPHCGSDRDLATVELLEALALLARITRNADGTLEPEYAGESKVLWDTQHWDTDELVCRNCDAMLTAADLIEPPPTV